jgi:hypothetical protein
MKNGPYELVKAPKSYPGELYRNKYCYEHHLVWWENTGEIIQDGEVIHHKNGNKRDNRFENLKKETNSKHSYKHRDKARFFLAWCAGCGGQVIRKRRQSCLSKTNQKYIFCSKECSGRLSQEYMKLPDGEDQVITYFYAYSDKMSNKID